MARFSVVVAIVFLFVTAPSVSNATITCGQVVAWLTPCIPFGVFGGTVPPDCCKGIKELNAAQNTTTDRRIACSCIQEGAAAIPGIDYDRINTLGDVCGSPCPYKVYPSTNCSAFSVILAIVFLFVTAASVSNATVICSEVVVFLTPCIPFGMFGGTVPPDCCKGIKGLNAAQNTTMDRRIACSCIQEGAARIPRIKYDRINTLGDVCVALLALTKFNLY